MSVGENIKRIRLQQDVSQILLAEKADVSQAMICQLERGTKNPSLQLANAIVEVLGCTMEDFLKIN